MDENKNPEWDFLKDYASSITSGTTPNWLDQYKNTVLSKWSNGSIGNAVFGSGDTSDNFPSLLPMAIRVSAQTIGMGGTRKSKIRQLREDRINKLRKLDGLEPNIVLSDDEEVPGLVSVTPISAPTGQIFYMDYTYGNEDKTYKNQKILEIIDLLRGKLQ